MKLCALLSLTLESCAWAADTPRNDGLSWATLHGDLQSSGFHPQFPKGPLRLIWRRELWRELTGPRAEVIVGGGLAFMGTYAGDLYAWDASGLIANLFSQCDRYGGFYGGANFGWESQGCRERAKAAGQPCGLVNEWHGPSSAIVSVADNRIYFPVGSQVIGLEGAQ